MDKNLRNIHQFNKRLNVNKGNSKVLYPALGRFTVQMGASFSPTNRIRPYLNSIQIKPVRWSVSEKSPAFQFYPKDLLSDIEAMSMSNEVMGMYFKLLCFDWINDGIPDDNPTILKITNFEWVDKNLLPRDVEIVQGAITTLILFLNMSSPTF